MFPRSYRLPVKEAHTRLRKLFSSPYFIVKTAVNTTGHNRFGIIIANSSVKKSTKRHFWKRRFIGILRGWPNFQKDFLFIISPKINNLDQNKLKEEINESLPAAGR
ncbi:MAG: ribonuclease P protein component [Patescibacteria group bacterium]|nr:ribonuclease P protein component [Patescibacteria group bacterium]MDE2015148.1 ribonuclease P protein component [Patescibacteria group bacterium]MDE2226576.1 ribonuclease P protein component [Patescibacteria group bacterium]